jgi:HK97 gp10 family phage protein
MAQSKVTMDLKGFEHLQAAIKRAPELVKEHAFDAVAKTTFASGQRMRATVAVKTGRLKRGISTSARGLNGRVLIDPDLFYWRFLEYGTVNMAARPFIRPSAEAEAPHYLDRLRAFVPKLERDWSSGSLR